MMTTSSNVPRGTNQVSLHAVFDPTMPLIEFARRMALAGFRVSGATPPNVGAPTVYVTIAGPPIRTVRLVDGVEQ